MFLSMCLCSIILDNLLILGILGHNRRDIFDLNEK